MGTLFARLTSIFSRMLSTTWITRTREGKTSSGGSVLDPSCSMLTGGGVMPRNGKSSQSKKSSEFNQMDFNGLSWDTLIDDFVPPKQEQKSSATSKRATDSQLDPISSPSTTSPIKFGDLAVTPYQPMPTFQEEMNARLARLFVNNPWRSTTTTPAEVIRLDSNGLTGRNPASYRLFGPSS